MVFYTCDKQICICISSDDSQPVYNALPIITRDATQHITCSILVTLR